MRESTSLQLPSLEKGSSIYDYKVRIFYICTLIGFPLQVNPHTGDWSHWNSLMENYVPPDIRLNIRKLLSFMLLFHQSNQLRQHPDSQREQH